MNFGKVANDMEQRTMELDVVVHQATMQLYRLTIYYKGEFIGEYDRSMLHNVKEKIIEINHVADQLLKVFRERGPFIVRQDSGINKKVIFVDDKEVGVIGLEWEDP